MSHILSISYYEDCVVKNIFFMYYRSRNDKFSFIDRIKYSFSLLFNRGIEIEDIVLSIESIEEVIDFLEKSNFHTVKTGEFNHQDSIKITYEDSVMTIFYDSDYGNFDISINGKNKLKRIFAIIFKGDDTKYDFAIYDESTIQELYIFLLSKTKQKGESL